MVTFSGSAYPIPTGYDNLFNLDKYDMSKKEIETIILEVCNNNRELWMNRKLTYFNARLIDSIEQSASVKEKIDAYCQKSGITLASGSVFFSTAAAFAAATPLGGALTAAAHMFNAIADYTSKLRDGKITGCDHTYQLLASLISQYQELLRKADQNVEQDTAAIDRLIQSIHRIFELAVSNS